MGDKSEKSVIGCTCGNGKYHTNFKQKTSSTVHKGDMGMDRQHKDVRHGYGQTTQRCETWVWTDNTWVWTHNTWVWTHNIRVWTDNTKM
jgi:hypothetical protein